MGSDRARGDAGRAAERVASIPGIERAAFANAVPLTMYNGSSNGRSARIDDRASPQHVEFSRSYVGPGYFGTLGIRVLGGREFATGRCLILADGFYEFTSHSDPKSKRKHKWLFTLKEAELFGIAGLWRADSAVGEAFTMLTCAPAPDVAPYHDRSIVIVPPAEWSRWLDPAIPAHALLKPLPAGSLTVEQVN